ncbi:MAG TPA: helix-turn-helix transcriptional regulator [Thermoanaerobaculia bacterium]|nr:helix-turn-helix transcriptional regulator [Thermoanaerobaculia bacterium]
MPGRSKDLSHESHRRAISKVLPFMRERLTEEIDLGQLADVAIMSPHHFVRTFREQTGVPPGKFLGALRVEAAKRLLIETDDPILDICHQISYSSLGSFSTHFTELVGLSPGRFRQLGKSFYRDLAALMEVVSSCPLPPGAPVLAASVERLHPDQVVFAGLFDTPIPQGRPLSCAVLLDRDQRDFKVAAPRHGVAFLFAVAMDTDAPPLDLLTGGSAVRAVAGSGPLCFDQGPPGPLSLRFRPLDPFDPPMLLALPLLLHEKAAELGHVEPIPPLDEPMAAPPG